MMEDGVRSVIDGIRRELDEHLDELNANSGEITAVQDYVGEIEARLDKLSERVDALQTLLLAQAPTKTVRLSAREREVFRILVDAPEPCTSATLGKRTGFSQDVVAQTLYSMRQKGIPVLAQLVQDQMFYALDEGFRNGQGTDFKIAV